MPELNIIADENIPLVQDWFGRLGRVRTVPGRSISREILGDAEVLLVRSVTPVGRDLLHGSAVRFVGSATIGVDHIETEYLNENEIAWASAPGSNADSVVEYVLAALACLAVRRDQPLRGKTLGLVGDGNIGSRLARRAEALGMAVLKNDPPRAAAEPEGGFLPLEEVLRRADVLTCHVPLTREGPYATHHLIGPEELAAMRPGAWLVNTARGAVVDNAALLGALRSIDRRADGLRDRSPGRSIGAVVLDVWEREPTPSRELMARVDIATPHIAGYSYDGKVAGTRMLLEALAAELGLSIPPIPDPVESDRRLSGAPDARLPEPEWLDQLVRRMYDIRGDDRRMRLGRALGGWPVDDAEAAAHFSGLRRDYPMRRTFGVFDLAEAQVPSRFRGPAADAVGVRLRSVPVRAQV